METPDRRNRLKDVDAVKFSEPKQTKIPRWVIFVLCALAVVLIGAAVAFGIHTYIQNVPSEQNMVISAVVLCTDTADTEEGDVVYAPYKDGIVMASRNEICMYGTDGETKWELAVGVLNPFIKVNGNYILVAGKNTKDYLLIKNGKILVQANTTYNILNAGVAANGAFYLVEEEPYYKGLLTVRDSKNKDMFVWHSGASYIIDAAFNDRTSELAITTLTATAKAQGADEESVGYTGATLLFKLHESAPFKTYEYPQQIATNVYYTAGRFIVVTDTEVVAYAASDGETVWTYPYTPHTLQRTDFKSGKLALLTLAEDGTQTMHILKSDGKPSGRVDGLKNTGDISLADSIIAAGNGSTLTVYRLNGAQRYTVSLPKTYDDICLFNNGQYLLGANNIVLDILSAK